MQLFWADLMFLQERQRAVTFERNKTVTMPELVHEFVEAIKLAEGGQGA